MYFIFIILALSSRVVAFDYYEQPSEYNGGYSPDHNFYGNPYENLINTEQQQNWLKIVNYNEMGGGGRCPDIKQPLCATNGEEYLYFENPCQFEVRNYEELIQGRIEYYECPLSECRPKCHQCPDYYEPVCARFYEELKEFPNRCEYERAICETNIKWQIINTGSCFNYRKPVHTTDNELISPHILSESPSHYVDEYVPISARYQSDLREFNNERDLQRAIYETNIDWQFGHEGPCFRPSPVPPPPAQPPPPLPPTSTSNYVVVAEPETKCPKSCTREYNPVCAKFYKDFKEFSNICEYQRITCETKENWQIINIGPCPKQTINDSKTVIVSNGQMEKQEPQKTGLASDLPLNITTSIPITSPGNRTTTSLTLSFDNNADESKNNDSREDEDDDASEDNDDDANSDGGSEGEEEDDDNDEFSTTTKTTTATTNPPTTTLLPIDNCGKGIKESEKNCRNKDTNKIKPSPLEFPINEGGNGANTSKNNSSTGGNGSKEIGKVHTQAAPTIGESNTQTKAIEIVNENFAIYIRKSNESNKATSQTSTAKLTGEGSKNISSSDSNYNKSGESNERGNGGIKANETNSNSGIGTLALNTGNNTTLENRGGTKDISSNDNNKNNNYGMNNSTESVQSNKIKTNNNSNSGNGTSSTKANFNTTKVSKNISNSGGGESIVSFISNIKISENKLKNGENNSNSGNGTLTSQVNNTGKNNTEAGTKGSLSSDVEPRVSLNSKIEENNNNNGNGTSSVIQENFNKKNITQESEAGSKNTSNSDKSRNNNLNDNREQKNSGNGTLLSATVKKESLSSQSIIISGEKTVNEGKLLSTQDNEGENKQNFSSQSITSTGENNNSGSETVKQDNEREIDEILSSISNIGAKNIHKTGTAGAIKDNFSSQSLISSAQNSGIETLSNEDNGQEIQEILSSQILANTEEKVVVTKENFSIQSIAGENNNNSESDTSNEEKEREINKILNSISNTASNNIFEAGTLPTQENQEAAKENLSSQSMKSSAQNSEIETLSNDGNGEEIQDILSSQIVTNTDENGGETQDNFSIQNSASTGENNNIESDTSNEENEKKINEILSSISNTALNNIHEAGTLPTQENGAVTKENFSSQSILSSAEKSDSENLTTQEILSSHIKTNAEENNNRGNGIFVRSLEPLEGSVMEAIYNPEIYARNILPMNAEAIPRNIEQININPTNPLPANEDEEFSLGNFVQAALNTDTNQSDNLTPSTSQKKGEIYNGDVYKGPVYDAPTYNFIYTSPDNPIFSHFFANNLAKSGSSESGRPNFEEFLNNYLNQGNKPISSRSISSNQADFSEFPANYFKSNNQANMAGGSTSSSTVSANKAEFSQFLANFLPAETLNNAEQSANKASIGNQDNSVKEIYDATNSNVPNNLNNIISGKFLANFLPAEALNSPLTEQLANIASVGNQENSLKEVYTPTDSYIPNNRIPVQPGTVSTSPIPSGNMDFPQFVAKYLSTGETTSANAPTSIANNVAETNSPLSTNSAIPSGISPNSFNNLQFLASLVTAANNRDRNSYPKNNQQSMEQFAASLSQSQSIYTSTNTNNSPELLANPEYLRNTQPSDQSNTALPSVMPLSHYLKSSFPLPVLPALPFINNNCEAASIKDSTTCQNNIPPNASPFESLQNNTMSSQSTPVSSTKLDTSINQIPGLPYRLVSTELPQNYPPLSALKGF